MDGRTISADPTREAARLIARLRKTAMIAPMVLDGPINGDWFEAYVTQILVPISAGDDEWPAR